MPELSFNIIEITLLSALIVFFAVQLCFYWFSLAKTYYYLRSGKHLKHDDHNYSPVSVIMYVRGSGYDLKKVLPQVLNQKYPEFEVIVVCDGASFENEDQLSRLKSEYPNLYSTNVPEDTRNISRKKLGLTLGIKAARFVNLLFTEPDNTIRDENWISLMASQFSEKRSVIIGLAAIRPRKGFLKKYMAYDYFFCNLQMLSFTISGHTYTACGRNLGYKRKHFDEQKGFVNHRLLKQGEDDLFVNDISTRNNTVAELSPQSIVRFAPDRIDWERMKTDRAITKRFYKRGPVAFWRFEKISRAGFYLSFVACIAAGYPFDSVHCIFVPAAGLILFLIRLVSLSFVINKTAGKLKLAKFYALLPIFDCYQMFSDTWFCFQGKFKTKENFTYRYEKR